MNIDHAPPLSYLSYKSGWKLSTVFYIKWWDQNQRYEIAVVGMFGIKWQANILSSTQGKKSAQTQKMLYYIPSMCKLLKAAPRENMLCNSHNFSKLVP